MLSEINPRREHPDYYIDNQSKEIRLNADMKEGVKTENKIVRSTEEDGQTRKGEGPTTDWEEVTEENVMG